MSATLINISFPISETFLVSMNPNQTDAVFKMVRRTHPTLT